MKVFSIINNTTLNILMTSFAQISKRDVVEYKNFLKFLQKYYQIAFQKGQDTLHNRCEGDYTLASAEYYYEKTTQ